MDLRRGPARRVVDGRRRRGGLAGVARAHRAVLDDDRRPAQGVVARAVVVPRPGPVVERGRGGRGGAEIQVDLGVARARGRHGPARGGRPSAGPDPVVDVRRAPRRAVEDGRPVGAGLVRVAGVARRRGADGECAL